MIDESRLKELEDDFGAEDLAEIIDAFLEEASEGVEALGGMLSDGPHPERKAQLHFLKGCARNIGATSLGDLCERYEQQESAAPSFSVIEYNQVLEGFENVRQYFAGQDERKSA